MIGPGLYLGIPYHAGITEAAVAALNPLALYNFTDTTSLLVGRDGSGGNPSVGGTTSIGVALSKASMGGLTASAYIASQPDFIANGNFTVNLDGWTARADSTLTNPSAGRMRVTSTATGTAAGADYELTGLTVGRTYRVTCQILAKSGSATVGFAVVTDLAITGLSGLTVGEIVTHFVATATSRTLQVRYGSGNGSLDSWFEFTGVSVKALPGIHAIAPADNQRPVLASASGRLTSRFDGVDDTLNLAFAAATLSVPTYIAMALKTVDTLGTFATMRTSNARWATWISTQTTSVVGGNGEFALLNGADSYVNPAVGGNHRTGLANALAGSSVPTIVEVTSAFADLTTSTSINLLYDESSAGARVAGDCYGAVVFVGTPTDANRALIRQWLANLSGGATV